MPQQAFPRTIDSLQKMFGFIDRVLSDSEVDSSVGDGLRLAVDELFTNMVRYQRSTDDVVLALEKDHDRLVLSLKATGVDRFDPSQVPDPNLEVPLEQREPGGMGVYLVRRVVDELRYDYDPAKRESVITLIKNLEG